MSVDLGNEERYQISGERLKPLNPYLVMITVTASIAIIACALILPWRLIAIQTEATVERYASVVAYGAKGDGITDDSEAFAKAFARAFDKGIAVYLPRGTYLVNGELTIRSGMVIRADGATIKHANDSETIFSASHADDWVIDGPLTLTGTRSAPNQIASETGLSIDDCSHYVVDKLTVKNFKGNGITIRGESAGVARGEHGKLAFITFANNSVGLRIESGSAEYNLLALTSFYGNDTAAVIASGNNVIVASNIVDNANGVQLLDGPNDGHGIVSACNINHNAGFNIRADDVESGFTFSGSHIYGDSRTSGLIRMTRSSGILIDGGMLDAAIVDRGGGPNVVSNNIIAGDKCFISGDSDAVITSSDVGLTPKRPSTFPSCATQGFSDRSHTVSAHPGIAETP